MGMRKDQVEQKRKDQIDIKSKARAIAILQMEHEMELTKAENINNPKNLVPVAKVKAGLKKTNSTMVWRKRILTVEAADGKGYNRPWRYESSCNRVKGALDKLCREYERTAKYEAEALVETVTEKDITSESVSWANAVVDALGVPYEGGDFEVTVTANASTSKVFTILGAKDSSEAKNKAYELARNSEWNTIQIDASSIDRYNCKPLQVKSYHVSDVKEA